MSENTVKTPVSDRLLRDEDDVVPWANKECIPLLREMRDVHNYQQTYKVDATTAGDGAAVTAWESERVPADGDWLMEMRAFGVSAGGSHEVAVRTHHWKFVGSVGTLLFAANTLTGLSGFPGLPTFTFDATKMVMRFTVQDDNTASRFSAVIRVQEIKL